MCKKAASANLCWDLYIHLGHFPFKVILLYGADHFIAALPYKPPCNYKMHAADFVVTSKSRVMMMIIIINKIAGKAVVTIQFMICRNCFWCASIIRQRDDRHEYKEWKTILCVDARDARDVVIMKLNRCPSPSMNPIQRCYRPHYSHEVNIVNCALTLQENVRLRRVLLAQKPSL